MNNFLKFNSLYQCLNVCPGVFLSPSGGRGQSSGPCRPAAPPGWTGYAACEWRLWFCRMPHRVQTRSPAAASSLHLCLMAGRGWAMWTWRSSYIWKRDRVLMKNMSLLHKTATVPVKIPIYCRKNAVHVKNISIRNIWSSSLTIIKPVPFY